ncbi:MAG: hypothetical protein HOV67_11925 [Kribbellaceae bacterium]|nr:hypothetical protein [Kribbellaceae bacterium]
MSGWESVREFTLGNVERPATRSRNRIEWGPNAIRVASGSTDDRVLTPYAYVGADRSLYLDDALTQLLCRVVERSEHTWSVLDADGTEVGTITRIPSGRPLIRPNWRIAQPGRPELVGRTEWLSGPPGRLAAKAASRLLVGVLDGLTGIGDEGGDQPTMNRTLEWRAAEELAMYSEGTTLVTIKADWLDRRLAFAYCLIGK